MWFCVSEAAAESMPRGKKKKGDEEEETPKGLKRKNVTVTHKRLNGSLGLAIDESYYITAVHDGGAAALCVKPACPLVLLHATVIKECAFGRCASQGRYD